MRIIAAATVACLAAGPAFAADPIEGDWMPSAASKVHIAPCRGQPSWLCGDIVWLKTPDSPSGGPLRDANNPDPAQRGRTIIGLQFLRDFQRVEAGRWNGGKIYEPKSGKTYDAKLSLNPDGTLKLEGCVAIFCQAQTWKRPG